MQCPDCKRFMRQIREPHSARDGGEYECRNPSCPPGRHANSGAEERTPLTARGPERGPFSAERHAQRF